MLQVNLTIFKQTSIFKIIQAGARIVIHNSMTKALVDEYGHDLSPNMHTQIAIQEVYLCFSNKNKQY